MLFPHHAMNGVGGFYHHQAQAFPCFFGIHSWHLFKRKKEFY